VGPGRRSLRHGDQRAACADDEGGRDQTGSHDDQDDDDQDEGDNAGGATVMGKLLLKGWRDAPLIRAALKERSADDIATIDCDRCGSVTYYNQGSHCICEHCNADLTWLTDQDNIVIMLDDRIDAESDESHIR
jgi:hypothetical protein